MIKELIFGRESELLYAKMSVDCRDGLSDKDLLSVVTQSVSAWMETAKPSGSWNQDFNVGDLVDHLEDPVLLSEFEFRGVASIDIEFFYAIGEVIPYDTVLASPDSMTVAREHAAQKST